MSEYHWLEDELTGQNVPVQIDKDGEGVSVSLFDGKCDVPAMVYVKVVDGALVASCHPAAYDGSDQGDVTVVIIAGTVIEVDQS